MSARRLCTVVYALAVESMDDDARADLDEQLAGSVGEDRDARAAALAFVPGVEIV